MKSLLRRYCILLALLIYWLPASHAQEKSKVQQIKIEHVGPPAVSDELIRANIRVKVGDAYTKTGVDDDVRNLFGTGFFYNIRVLEEPSDSGVNLTYVVQGKPLLTDIKFSGNKQYGVSKLKKKLTSKTGAPLDERKLFTDSQELQKMYQKAGYQKTQVKYVLNINERAGRGTVTFEIAESPKVRVASVEFVGASAFAPKKLSKQIKTRKRWMFSWLTGSGVLKDEQFEDDKEKLAEFYHGEGYIDFEIKEVKLDQINPKRIAIRFVIFEGKKYSVGTVAVKGNALFPTADITKSLKMNPGRTFTPKGLSKDTEAIQDFYGSKGYIDTRIGAVKNANTETGNIVLTYQIEEGDKSFIEKIEIRGNTKTKDKVIRRELAVSPGEPFDMVRVKLSKQRLEGLQYFEKVDTQNEQTDVPNRKNLIVGVDEKNTGNFTLGAGFSSVDSVVGFAEVSQGNFDLFKPPNFTGGGQKFRLRITIGTLRQDYVLTFIEPWFLNRKLSFSTELYRRKSNYLSSEFEETQTGVRLGLTRALGSDFLIGGVSYTIEEIGIHNVNPLASQAIQDEAGNRLVSKVGMSLAYDTRNNATLPDRGQRTELLTEVAGGPLGGQTDFMKVELRSSWYIKGFATGHVLEVGGRTGVVNPYGQSPTVPLFDRWFLGGMYSLRGYKLRKVGPVDSTTEPLGGDSYWFSSVEYSIPIIERLRVALFYDIGMVYQKPFSFNPNYQYKLTPTTRGFGTTQLYNDNYGIGFRLNLPIGPLRLDYGIPIHHDPSNGRSGKFQFGVGYTREF